MEKSGDAHNLKCSPLEGFAPRRSVAEPSIQLHGSEGDRLFKELRA